MNLINNSATNILIGLQFWFKQDLYLITTGHARPTAVLKIIFGMGQITLTQTHICQDRK